MKLHPKRQALLRAIDEGSITINYKSPDLAEHDRLTYYHHRRVAALDDPRVMSVVIRLQSNNVVLEYCPEETELADQLRGTGK